MKKNKYVDEVSRLQRMYPREREKVTKVGNIVFREIGKTTYMKGGKAIHGYIIRAGFKGDQSDAQRIYGGKYKYIKVAYGVVYGKRRY